LKGLNAYVDERMAALSGRTRELLTSASAAKLPAELSRIEGMPCHRHELSSGR